jgi:hypothetical protein
MQYCHDEVEDLGNHKHFDTLPPYRLCNSIWPHQINSFRLLPLPYSPLILSFTYTDNYFAAFSIILQRSFVQISPHLWPNIITLAPIQISYRTNHVPRVAFIDGGTLNLQIIHVRSSQDEGLRTLLSLEIDTVIATVVNPSRPNGDLLTSLHEYIACVLNLQVISPTPSPGLWLFSHSCF